MYYIPKKMYFPFVLGNGIDSVMVDYSGSMHCDSGHLHLEQHGGAICCWEKIIHRTLNRHMVPIVQFPYRLMAYDGELYEVGDFYQEFDPIKSILSTEIETTIIKMKIETFLTHESLYVEHFEVLEVEANKKPIIVFIGRKPINPYFVNYKIQFPDGFQISFLNAKNNIITGQYAFDEVKGCINIGVKTYRKRQSFNIGNEYCHIKIQNLKRGDIFERYISVMDNTHESDYLTKSQFLIKKALRDEYKNIKQKHIKQWKKFHSQVSINLPDKEMEKVYRTSLWLIHASQHPNGFITEGLYSMFKGGGYTCHADLLYAFRALVTSNMRESALKLTNWYHYASKYAKTYAKQLNKEGTYFPWMSNWKGKSTYFENANEYKNIEKYNNSCLSIQLFDIYRFWGDKNQLKKNILLIKEILDFLIAEIVGRDKKGFTIKPIEGGDENIDRVNDTLHLISLIEGLKGFIEGCYVLKINVDKKYNTYLEGLKKVLEDNYKNGILKQFKGDKLKMVSSSEFTYYIFSQPEGIPVKNIYEAVKYNMGKWGLTNAGTYRNLIWPWTEHRAAVAFSTIDPFITYERLKNSIQFTSTHCIFPEKIRPDGYWILFGYLTSHTSFIYAVNSLLASDNGKKLYIGAGFPKDWQDIKFSNIYTPSGFGISMELIKGKVKHLIIENCRDESRNFTIHLLNYNFGKEGKIIKKTLLPGKNYLH